MFYKRFLGMSDKSKPNLVFCARVFANTALRSRVIRIVLTRSRALSYLKTWAQDLPATKTLLFSMIFVKVERRRTIRTSSESLIKRA